MAIDRIKVKKEADKFLAAGKVERAIDELRKILDDNPKDMNTLNTIGDLYLQIRRIPEAVEVFRRLAIAYERDGFAPKATAILQKTMRAAPDDIDIAQRLADLYRQTNKIKEAVQVHLQVAEYFQKKGLIKRALEEFAKLVDLDPKNLKNKVRLADLYNKEGMKDRAAAIYLEVAESLAMEQMHAEANQILERAKAMVSTPQVYLTQSRLGVIQGDYATAAQHLREGLSSNARNPELLEALAEIELRSGNPDRALEALAEIAQLPEKTVPLCEKALRNLVSADRADEGLRLFSPIARELARRGSGDLVSRSLHGALQGNIGTEAWILLAEIAHQSGNKTEREQALQSAYALAKTHGDQNLQEHLSTQLVGMGAIPGEPAQAPFGGFGAPGVPGGTQLPPISIEITRHGGETEMDPIRRLRIDQISREAEALLRSGSSDRAVETYKKALELDPADLTIIEAIVAVHRTTGHLTKVQMQYVQSAQALARIGKTREATHLLDMAEQLFPGSTRIHRRTLGLPEPGAVPPPPARPAPPPVKARTPEPALAPEAPIALPPPPGDMEALIGLDVPGFEPPPPARPAPPVPAFEPIPVAESLPVLPDFGALPPPEPEPASLDASDLGWMEATLTDLAAPAEPLPSAPTVELPPEPEAPPLTVPAPAPVPEELTSLLGDIDFQLDYGSPDEAKLEIEAALRQFPGHPELVERMDRAELALQKLGHLAKASALDESDFTSSFFDLTDVLGTALMDSGEGEEMHDATHVVEKIQSVDELFSAFREGVEKQVKGDDYDTHYNLGIAYKEMMLIDPAIEEFKIAMGDPERTLECCSMLSICEQARGDLDRAVAWLNQGIEAPGFPPEDSIGLLYDLAEILLQQGHTAVAAEKFRAVHDMDPDYRDVAARLA